MANHWATWRRNALSSCLQSSLWDSRVQRTMHSAAQGVASDVALAHTRTHACNTHVTRAHTQHTRIPAHTHKHAYETHTSRHICVRVSVCYMCVCLCVHMRVTCVRACVCMPMCVHALHVCARVLHVSVLHVCVLVCMPVCACVTCACACYMCVCACVLHVCVCARVCVAAV